MCEKAINHCKLICQSDNSVQETEAQRNLLLRKKHFLEKAKTLAFKCGDDNQMRMQNSDFTAQPSERSEGSKQQTTDFTQNFYDKAVKFDTELVSMAKAEYGEDHSEYAKAVLSKANSLVSASTENPVIVLEEIAEAQKAEVAALAKTGRNFSLLFMRTLLLKACVH